VDLFVDSKILVLLFVANGAPVIAKDLLAERFRAPLDGGLRLSDGEPVLGHSKTIRGVFVSLLFSALAAWLIGLGWAIGLMIGAGAMLGDVFSSFLKRRMKMPASSRASGLDQLPEAVFPLLICMLFLPVTLVDATIVTVAFVVAEIQFSKLLYRLHIRDRPY
jgi:hypothetical protein